MSTAASISVVSSPLSQQPQPAAQPPQVMCSIVTSAAASIIPPVLLANNKTPSTAAASNPSPAMSMAQPNRSQPVPEEKLTAHQSRKKQELLDHKAAGEGNLEREEKLEISGKDARYMMMQKLARQNTVCAIFFLRFILFCCTFIAYCTWTNIHGISPL